MSSSHALYERGASGEPSTRWRSATKGSDDDDEEDEAGGSSSRSAGCMPCAFGCTQKFWRLRGMKRTMRKRMQVALASDGEAAASRAVTTMCIVKSESEGVSASPALPNPHAWCQENLNRVAQGQW